MEVAAASAAFPSAMFDVATTAPLIVFAFAAAITPGGATALAMTSGVRFGFRRSLQLLTAIVIGMATLGAASSLGLASLVHAAPALELAVRAAGTIYLLWLSFSIARSGPPESDTGMSQPLGLLAGILLLWLNPKAWAVTVGAAATFGGVGYEPAERAILLATAFGTAAAVSMAVWCTTGVLLAKLLRTPRHWKVVNFALATLLAATVIQMWR